MPVGWVLHKGVPGQIRKPGSIDHAEADIGHGCGRTEALVHKPIPQRASRLPRGERRILPVVATHRASCDIATVVEAGVCSVT
jgi:hypothetical protein